MASSGTQRKSGVKTIVGRDVFSSLLRLVKDTPYSSRIVFAFIWLSLILTVIARLTLIARLEPFSIGDTGVYMEMAGSPLFSATFLTGLRPLVVPLFYKLCGVNQQIIIVAQAALAALSWGILALSFARSLRTPLARIISAATILAFSFCMDVLRWDGVLLSESFFLSLMALHVAAWLWFMREPRGWRQTAMVILTGVLWAFSRDTSAYVLLMLALPLAVRAFINKRVQHAIIALAFILIFGLNWMNVERGQRWLFPFLNVLSQRILPDAEAQKFFVERGMPVSPALLKLSGQWASSEDWAYYRAPELEEFRQWVRARGKTSYLKFLASRPIWFFTAPSDNIGDLLTPELDTFDPPGIRAPLPDFLEKILYPSIFFRSALMGASVRDWLKALLWFVLSVFSAVIVWRARRREALVPVVMILLAYPVALIIWHGDAMELGRHSLKIAVGLRLATWLLLLLALDSLLARSILKAQGVLPSEAV